VFFPIAKNANRTEIAWRDMMKKSYRLPQKTNSASIMNATLQPTPEDASRKTWLKIRVKSRARGEDIADSAVALLEKTKEMGLSLDTDNYLATREHTTTNAVAYWRKALQSENNRYLLKIRVGNLAQ
jgi:hypothetical protein